MDSSLRVLLIDDDPANCTLVAHQLCQEFPAVQAERIAEAQGFDQALEADGLNLVISDYDLGWSDGLAVLRAVKARHPDCPVILFTDTISQEIATEAIQIGLDGYVPKSPSYLACLMVAARTALEKALQRRAMKDIESRYHDLFAGVPIGLYRSTAGGQILNANPTLVQMLGYPDLASLLAMNVTEVVKDPNTRQRWQALLQHEGATDGFKVAIRRTDGTTMWVEDNARTVRDPDGVVRYCEGSLIDITARKQAEDALERRAVQLALINDIGEKIAAVLELDLVLNRTAHLVQHRFDYHHVALFTLDHKRDEIVMRARAGDLASLFPPQHRLKLDQGIVGWVARHGKSLLANDVHIEPNYVNLYPDLVPTQSELSVPIQVSEKVVGVLDIQSPQRNAFDKNDVMVMETLADQIAVAIENARLYEEIKQRNQESAVLNEIGQAITSTLNMEETLALITNHTTHLLDVAAASVFLCDEDKEFLRLVAGSSVDADMVVGKPLPIGQGIAGWVAQHGEPALVTDTSQDPRWFKDFDQESRFMAHSILCVPLQIKGQVIGVLQAINKRKDDFDQVDLRFLNALAAPAATAIEHARLFEQVQSAHEQLQALSHRLVEVQETERRNISRELHDESGQILSALLLSLSLLEREAEHPAAVLARAADLANMIEELIENLHRLAVNLRPASLDHLGLAVALKQYLETFRETYSQQVGIGVQFEMTGMEGERLPPAVETALYRIVQEALTNVIRHAQATQVDVLLERRGDQVITIIEDNGVGFDLQAATKSGRLGLFGMQERAEMLGGILVVESIAEIGTTVLVEVPCGHSDSDS